MKTVFAFLILFSSTAFASQSSELALAQGRAAEGVGNNKKAAQFYRRALSAPESIEQSTISLARVLNNLGEFDESLGLLTEYLKTTNPFHVDAHLLLSDVYINKGMLKEAMAEVNSVDALRPGLTRSAENRGLIHLKNGKFDSAIEVFSNILKSDNSNWTAHYYRAKAYTSLNQWEPANSDYKICVEQRPSNLEVQNLYAESFIKLSRWIEAERTLHYIVKVNANDVQALAQLAEVYGKMDRQDEMIGTYKKLIEIDPANADASQKLADAYIRLRLYKLAEDELNRQLKVNPGSDSAAKRLVAIWNIQRRADLVGAFLKSYLERGHGSAWAVTEYVNLLSQIGSYAQALDAVDNFRKNEKGDSPNVNLWNAFVYYKWGKVDQSIRELVQAQRQWPKEARVSYNLGLAYTAKKDFQKATIHYQHVGSDDPLYPKAQLNLAVIFESNGQIENAVTALKAIPPNTEWAAAIRSKINELERTRTPSSEKGGG